MWQCVSGGNKELIWNAISLPYRKPCAHTNTVSFPCPFPPVPMERQLHRGPGGHRLMQASATDGRREPTQRLSIMHSYMNMCMCTWIHMSDWVLVMEGSELYSLHQKVCIYTCHVHTYVYVCMYVHAQFEPCSVCMYSIYTWLIWMEEMKGVYTKSCIHTMYTCHLHIHTYVHVQCTYMYICTYEYIHVIVHAQLIWILLKISITVTVLSWRHWQLLDSSTRMYVSKLLKLRRHIFF